MTASDRRVRHCINCARTLAAYDAEVVAHRVEVERLLRDLGRVRAELVIAQAAAKSSSMAGPLMTDAEADEAEHIARKEWEKWGR